MQPVGQSTMLMRAEDRPHSHAAAIDPEAPNLCRWCLQRYDPERQKPRTTWERGRLRTHLKMADNGSELRICDNCWDGAFGYATFSNGKVVPTNDPEVVPNLLLR